MEWRVKPGQWIDAGATLVDVTTDKVDVEVPAPAAGVVTSLAAEEGATVAVGGMLAEIDTSAAKPEGATAAPAAPGSTVAGTAGQSIATAAAEPALEPVLESEAKFLKNGQSKAGGPASHRAQRIAEREHLDLSTIRGSGPGRPDPGRRRGQSRGRLAAARAEERERRRAGRARAAARRRCEDRSAQGSRRGARRLHGAEPRRSRRRRVSARSPSARSTSRRASSTPRSKRAGRSEKVSFTHLIAFALVRAAREQPAMTRRFRREAERRSASRTACTSGLPSTRSAKTARAFWSCRLIKRRRRARLRAVPRALRRARRQSARRTSSAPTS